MIEHVLEEVMSLMQEQGIKRKDFAKSIGISKEYLSSVLNRKSIPSIHLLDRMLNFFGKKIAIIIADIKK